MELGTLSPRIEVEIVKENMFIHSLWPFNARGLAIERFLQSGGFSKYFAQDRSSDSV